MIPQDCDDEISTQPSNSNENCFSFPQCEAWAQLIYCSFNMLELNANRYCLKEDIFTAGRSSNCDLQFLREEHRISIYPLLSLTHFKIEKRIVRNFAVAYITDLSTNGTFINNDRKPIGKNNRRVLSHEDIISVGRDDYRLFTFLYLHKTFQANFPKEIQLDFLVVDKIGRGGFGDVYYVLEKTTCHNFAMKLVEIAANIHDDLDHFTELKVLRSMKHENIVEFHMHLMRDKKLFLILEFMEGGDLARLLSEKERLLEPVARHIFRQVTAGVDYLHSNQVVHRDIKPLNILLSNRTEYPVVKITDFGLSKKLKKFTASVKEIVGTPAYRAPELLGRPPQICDTRVDVWSLGVLLYYCLCGKYPFEKNNPHNEKLKFTPVHIWYHISIHPKKIIQRSLSVNFQERPFAKDILQAHWFSINLDVPDGPLSVEPPMKMLKTT